MPSRKAIKALKPPKRAPPPLDNNIYLRNQWQPKSGNVVPAKIRLCVQYYVDPDAKRQEEIDFCIRNNIANRAINQMLVIKSKHTKFPENSEKVQFVELEERPTYWQILEILRKEDDAVNIIANTDIAFDETINHVRIVQNPDLLALNRWELKTPLQLASAIPPIAIDAYDVWIWQGRLQTHLTEKDFAFTLGVAGCDNRVNYLFHTSGYRLCNPCSYIKAFHVHNTNIRRYLDKPRIPGPYCYASP
jgi:hypothetical protein